MIDTRNNELSYKTLAKHIETCPACEAAFAKWVDDARSFGTLHELLQVDFCSEGSFLLHINLNETLAEN